MTEVWPVLAVVYAVFCLGVIGFQIALILGAPWGHLTQGGQHRGALPILGRIGAGASIIMLAGQAMGILSVAGYWPGWANWTGWMATAVSAVAVILNWITPSPAERRLWAPITTIMFGLAVAVMLLS